MGDHTETVDIDFDPNVVSYEQMLKLFWKHHDPSTRAKRQYMSAIFFHDEAQEALAKKTMEEIKKSSSRNITTVIAPAEEFYEAENYHQKFMLQQHPALIQSFGIANIIRSHVCSRLNGYVSGNGKTKDFDQEWEKLGLNEKMADYIRNQMTKNRFGKF